MAPTIAIGTVTTGAPGTPAAVALSGTNSAAVLNFTIPQGATGPAGSGGGSATAIPFASVYHALSDLFLYYSVNSPNASATESGTLAAPRAALTWLPSGCTATALTVFSQQANPITITLRMGPSGALADTALSCSVSPGASCSVSGSVTIPAGSFVDFGVTGASGSVGGVWTALTCN
jgi:hypothetical protein